MHVLIEDLMRLGNGVYRIVCKSSDVYAYAEISNGIPVAFAARIGPSSSDSVNARYFLARVLSMDSHGCVIEQVVKRIGLPRLEPEDLLFALGIVGLNIGIKPLRRGEARGSSSSQRSPWRLGRTSRSRR